MRLGGARPLPKCPPRGCAACSFATGFPSRSDACGPGVVGTGGPHSGQSVHPVPPGLRAPTDPAPPWSVRGVVGVHVRAFPFVLQAVKLQEQEQKEETLRLQQLEERRRLQEAELRRVEEEKERALGLQRKERELRERLLSILLSKKADDPHTQDELGVSHADLLQPVLDILQTVSASCVGAASLHPLVGPLPPSTPKETPPCLETDTTSKNVNGSVAEEAQCKEGLNSRLAAAGDSSPEKRCPGVLSCIPDNNQQPKGLPAACDQNTPKKDIRSEQDKCNREPSGSRGRASGARGEDDRHKRERSRPRRASSREDGRQPQKERRQHKKHSRQDDSPQQRSASPDHSRSRRSHSRERSSRRERSRDRRGGSGRKRSRHRRSDRDRSRSGSPSRHRSTWNR